MRNRMLILLSRDYKEPPGVCVSARAYWAVVWRKGAVTKTSIEGLLHILRGRSTADSQYLSNSEPGGRKKTATWSPGVGVRTQHGASRYFPVLLY